MSKSERGFFPPVRLQLADITTALPKHEEAPSICWHLICIWHTLDVIFHNGRHSGQMLFQCCHLASLFSASSGAAPVAALPLPLWPLQSTFQDGFFYLLVFPNLFLSHFLCVDCAWLQKVRLFVHPLSFTALILIKFSLATLMKHITLVHFCPYMTFTLYKVISQMFWFHQPLFKCK